ncbi:hypothetical protein M1373_01020 [Candidatus Marsarchaeota archaeon]|nr:hypothetical protein [Candidatus Marsarchaeota archaeon]MCL5404249.1 hypothetical protein [Candidatus Marsarchaeota archaeon]
MGKVSAKGVRAQSAMEYLLTYGWAIILIVVFLGAMFYIGLFNPGRLVSTTCFANSGFLCSSPNAYGTTFSATIGQATGNDWNNVIVCFVPSNVSYPDSCNAYPSYIVGTLKSGQSHRSLLTIDSPSGTAYGTLWAEYSFGSYSNLMTEIATVRVKGLSAVSPPAPAPVNITLQTGIIAYAKIVVANLQNASTPAPFQQLIQLPESAYNNYIEYNPGQANFEFFYPNGTIIPAWIEGNSSSTLIVWLNLKRGIPADNSTLFYIGFANKTANLLSSSGSNGIGEAPELTAQYAEYDDGASVFDAYFNGLESASNFTLMPYASMNSVNASYCSSIGTAEFCNRIKALQFEISNTSKYSYDWVYKTAIPNMNGYILEANFESAGNPNPIDVAGLSSSDASNSTQSTTISLATQEDGSLFSINAQAANSIYFVDKNVGTYTPEWRYMNLTYFGPESATVDQGYSSINLYEVNSSGEYSSSYVAPLMKPYASVFVGTDSFSTVPGASVEYNWVRVRAMPPNLAMPAVFLGQAYAS